MKFWTQWTAAALTSIGLMAGAHAQDRGTKDEAKAMATAAFEHIKKVGAEKAYADFTTDKANWVKKDLYVMVFSSKGMTLAHGGNEKLVGKDLSNLKDPNGNPIVTGMIAMAGKGGGWYDYDWADPLTKKVAPKSTYAIKPPSGDGFLGVGIYR